MNRNCLLNLTYIYYVMIFVIITNDKHAFRFHFIKSDTILNAGLPGLEKLKDSHTLIIIQIMHNFGRWSSVICLSNSRSWGSWLDTRVSVKMLVIWQSIFEIWFLFILLDCEIVLTQLLTGIILTRIFHL